MSKTSRSSPSRYADHLSTLRTLWSVQVYIGPRTDLLSSLSAWIQKLKNELKSRDLDTTGKKADLAERLEAHLQAQSTEPSTQANGASTSSATQASDPAAATGKVCHATLKRNSAAVLQLKLFAAMQCFHLKCCSHVECTQMPNISGTWCCC